MSISEEHLSTPALEILFEPTDPQRAIIRVLGSKSEGLAKMYIGALRVLIDVHNPDRMQQSAHSIRELMEKMPQFWFETSLTALSKAGDGIKNQFTPLKERWTKLIKNTAAAKKGWIGEIDAPLKGFLQGLDDFFVWYDEHYPETRKHTAAFLKEFAPYAGSLPKEEIIKKERLRLENWMKFKEQFTNFSHHKFNEFLFVKNLRAFESMLLDEVLFVIHPVVLDDLEILDNLILKGEKDD